MSTYTDKVGYIVRFGGPQGIQWIKTGDAASSPLAQINPASTVTPVGLVIEATQGCGIDPSMVGDAQTDAPPDCAIRGATHPVACRHAIPVVHRGKRRARGPGEFRLDTADGKIGSIFTTDRERAQTQTSMELLGLDHAKVAAWQRQFAGLPPHELGIRVRSRDGRKGCLGVWRVEAEGERRQRKTRLVAIAVAESGERIPAWERKPDEIFHATPLAGAGEGLGVAFYRNTVEPIFHRELSQRGIVTGGVSYEAELVTWVEVS